MIDFLPESASGKENTPNLNKKESSAKVVSKTPSRPPTGIKRPTTATTAASGQDTTALLT